MCQVVRTSGLTRVMSTIATRTCAVPFVPSSWTFSRSGASSQVMDWYLFYCRRSSLTFALGMISFIRCGSRDICAGQYLFSNSGISVFHAWSSLLTTSSILSGVLTFCGNTSRHNPLGPVMEGVADHLAPTFEIPAISSS